MNTAPTTEPAPSAQDAKKWLMIVLSDTHPIARLPMQVTAEIPASPGIPRTVWLTCGGRPYRAGTMVWAEVWEGDKMASSCHVLPDPGPGDGCVRVNQTTVVCSDDLSFSVKLTFDREVSP
jgi:hypothetical protein